VVVNWQRMGEYSALKAEGITEMLVIFVF
jgi:hypothetical protein